MTHTNTEQQPEALRLVELYDFGDPATQGNAWKSAVCVELCRLHARVQELEAERDEADRRAGRAERHMAGLNDDLRRFKADQARLVEDSKRLDWLDQKNKGHSHYTGYVWQKEGYENNRGLVAAIQAKKEMMSARQAIDAAMGITQEK